MGGEGGHEQVIDLAGRVAAAADFDRHLFRRDEARGMFFLGAAIAKGEVAVGIRREREGSLDGEVKSVGDAVEHVAAAAERREVAGGGADGALAAEDDDTELARAGLRLDGFTAAQRARVDAEELKADRFGRK